MTPKDLLYKRVEHFRNGEADEIYDLYTEDSEFRKHFELLEEYREHFKKLVEQVGVPEINIYSEQVCENVADVLYLSKFDVDGEKQEYYCKSVFHQVDGKWLIAKEIHEKKKG